MPKKILIFILAVVLSCVTACTNKSDINKEVSKEQDSQTLDVTQIETSDLLVYEGIQISKVVETHTDYEYLKAVGCPESVPAWDLSLNGDVKQAYLCTDGVALLKSLSIYEEVASEIVDSENFNGLDNALVSSIPSLLFNAVMSNTESEMVVEMLSAIQIVSAADVISLNEQIIKPAILLLEYESDSPCVFVSFIPTSNGMVIVNATAMPQAQGYFDLLMVNNASFFSTFSEGDVGEILSSIDSGELVCGSLQSAKSKNSFYSATLDSMEGISEISAADISLYTTDEAVSASLLDFLKCTKYGATSYEVVHLSDAQIFSAALDISTIGPDDIPDTVMDTLGRSLVSSYVSQTGVTSVASNTVFQKLCEASSPYAADLNGADAGTYFILLDWPNNYTTVTVMRDTGNGAAIPTTYFLNEDDAKNELKDLLYGYGSVMG